MSAFRRAGAVAPALALACLVASGCSSSGSAKDTVSGWFGGDPGASEKVFYASAGGLAVHAEPSGASKTLGRLVASEKVVRSREKHGFAYISARGGSLKGWVASSRLATRRPPKAAASGTAKSGEREQTAVDAEAGQSPEASADASLEPSADLSANASVEASAEPSEAPAPVSDPSPAGPARPSGVGASVFDPY